MVEINERTATNDPDPQNSFVNFLPKKCHSSLILDIPNFHYIQNIQFYKKLAHKFYCKSFTVSLERCVFFRKCRFLRFTNLHDNYIIS